MPLANESEAWIEGLVPIVKISMKTFARKFMRNYLRLTKVMRKLLGSVSTFQPLGPNSIVCVHCTVSGWPWTGRECECKPEDWYMQCMCMSHPLMVWLMPYSFRSLYAKYGGHGARISQLVCSLPPAPLFFLKFLENLESLQHGKISLLCDKPRFWVQ